MARASEKIGIIVATAACLWSSASLAQQADSPLKSVLKMIGFATDVAPPAQRERRAPAPRSRRRVEVLGFGVRLPADGPVPLAKALGQIGADRKSRIDTSL